MQLIPMASQAKFWVLMFYFVIFFASDVFMVRENHHLQLEILTLRFNVASFAKSMVHPHILDLVS